MLTLNFLFYLAVGYLAVFNIIIMITLQVYKLSSLNSNLLLGCSIFSLCFIIAKGLGGF